jgi:ubiquinone/menaquinone biosynthesis C-methylase UbiE
MTEGYVLGNLITKSRDLEYNLHSEPLTRTLLKAGVGRAICCLDVGCGAGLVTRILAEMVGKNGLVHLVNRRLAWIYKSI